MQDNEYTDFNGRQERSFDTGEERPNEGQAVANIQRYLRTLSYLDPDIPDVPIDSVFDSATRDSLTAFQRKYGLSPTGRADKETFDSLYSAYLLALTLNEAPLPLPLFPIGNADYSVSLGTEGFLVEAIQYVIGELSILNGQYAAPAVGRSGIYDQRTAEAIRDFQEMHGIYPTGATDLVTWNTLVRVYESLLRDQKQ